MLMSSAEKRQFSVVGGGLKKGRLFIREQLEEILEMDDRAALDRMLKEVYLQDIAHVLRYFTTSDKKKIMYILGLERAAVLLQETDEGSRSEIVETMDNEFVSSLIMLIPDDEAADIVGRMPKKTAERVFKLLKPAKVDEIKALLKYEDDSAGGVMTRRFIALNKELTIAEAVERIRRRKFEQLNPKIYVTDEQGILVGFVPLGKMFARDTSQKLRDIMLTRFISVTANMDQEEVAHVAMKYDVFNMPVVDDSGRIVGVITHDDILDVIQEEATEDAFIRGGTGVEELEERTVMGVSKVRLPWLFASWLGGLGAFVIIERFSTGLEKIAVLSAFIPIIMGMGGNAGNQAATVIVRGLALGAVNARDIMSVLWREVRVGILLGALYGVLLGTVVHFYMLYVRHIVFVSAMNIGLVAGISILLVMTVGVAVGAFFPMFFKRINYDPAIATAPFVATALDIGGILIFFVVAKILL